MTVIYTTNTIKNIFLPNLILKLPEYSLVHKQSDSQFSFPILDCIGIVYIMIFKIAKKAGQIEKTIHKEKAGKPKKENGIKVISMEHVSTDYSTGINTTSGHTFLLIGRQYATLFCTMK